MLTLQFLRMSWPTTHKLYSSCPSGKNTLNQMIHKFSPIVTMQDSRETKYREIRFSRAFVRFLAVFCGSGYAKLNFDQWYARSTYFHHEANASCQLDQSVKWIIMGRKIY